MNSLMLQPNNLLSKFWVWLKKILFKKRDNKLNNISNYNEEKIIQEVSGREDDFKKSQNQEKRYVYVQDLDYDKEKKYAVDLVINVMNNEKRIEDLDLADMVRIKLLLNS